MPKPVVTGGSCKCSMGTTPGNINVTSQMKCKIEGKPIATIMDNSLVNLGTFGMCRSLLNPAVASATAAALGVLTPQPCVPSVSAPWSITCGKVKVVGKPILTDAATAICTCGMGAITITGTGQGKAKTL